MLTICAVAAVLTLGPAAAASAHDSLVSGSPGPDETVTAPLEVIELTFSDSLLSLGELDNSAAVQVRDAAGSFYGSGCVDVSGATARMDLALGAPGTYQVQWQVASGDGHVISESYAFVYDPPAGVLARSGAAAAPVCGEAQPAPAPAPSDESTGPSTPPAVDPEVAPAQTTPDASLPIALTLSAIGMAVLTLLVRRRRQ